MEIGMISVDRWSEESQAYFLTHLHSDHTKGLSPKWNRGPLFCSPITAKLFPLKFPAFNLSLLRVLQIGSHYSIPLISPSTGSKTKVQVLAIDADHCPGAVMYLFRGYFGCRLYTGDFRWEPTSEKALLGKCMLLSALGGDKIDILYLDNTYCNPSYSFPPREVVACQVVNIIASYPDHDVVIAINTLGKEDLLLHISRAFNIKIWVWPERLETMHTLGYHDVFTTNTSLTRVRAVPFYSFSIDTLEELNKIRPTIGIMPSGLPWMVKSLHEDECSVSPSLPICDKTSNKSTTKSDDVDKLQRIDQLTSVQKYHRYIYSLPYSDHSCFNEIQDFIKLVRPLNVRGIVFSTSCYIDPVYYLGLLYGQNQTTEQSTKKFQRRDADEKVEAVNIKSALGCNNSIDVSLKRKVTRTVSCLGVRSSRVSILRRQRCGAKISEVEGGG